MVSDVLQEEGSRYDRTLYLSKYREPMNWDEGMILRGNALLGTEKCE